MGGIRRGPRRLLGSALTSRVSQFQSLSQIKSIQSGTIDLNNVTSATATITAVDPNNAILVFLGMKWNDGSGAGGAVNAANRRSRLAFTNGTTITASRGASTAASHITGFTVVEFYPGVIKSVQRGTFDMSNQSTLSSTITTVTLAKTVSMMLGFTIGTATPLGDNQEDPVLSLPDATHVQGDRFATGGIFAFVVGYQVVEFY